MPPDDTRRLRCTRPRRSAPRDASSCTAADGGQPIGDAERHIAPEELLSGARRRQRELEAYRIGIMKIRERALPMKLTRVEQAADLSRLVFYFTAEGRVDFRELVKELASEFRTRIEMRQIGVRDEARMLSGYGTCGRQLCCSAWLTSFEPVSIKMAKLQDLTLNPTKLSGLCGRLKCCLRYELTDQKVLKKGHKPRADEPLNGDDAPLPDEPPTPLES